jgi:hypothetical protein
MSAAHGTPVGSSSSPCGKDECAHYRNEHARLLAGIKQALASSFAWESRGILNDLVKPAKKESK